MKALIRVLALALLPVAAHAQNTATPGSATLFRGSTNLGTQASFQACLDAAASQSAGTTYQCRVAVTVAAPPSPPPTQTPPPSGAVSYSTTFDQTEFPLSENGRWFKANNPWTYVRVANGTAYGTNGVTNSYDDSVAFLTGAWGADQTVEATVQVNSGTVGSAHEVELWLRGGSDTNNLWGYELCFWRTGQVQLGVWHGPFGQVDSLDSSPQPTWTPSTTLKTGDVIKASIVGNQIKAWINGVLKFQRTDTRFATGAPGLGFFIRPGGANNIVTLTSFSASSN